MLFLCRSMLHQRSCITLAKLATLQDAPKVRRTHSAVHNMALQQYSWLVGGTACQRLVELQPAAGSPCHMPLLLLPLARSLPGTPACSSNSSSSSSRRGDVAVKKMLAVETAVRSRRCSADAAYAAQVSSR
jgi:hypothetical protein